MGYNKDTNNQELQPGHPDYMTPEKYKTARQILARTLSEVSGRPESVFLASLAALPVQPPGLDRECSPAESEALPNECVPLGDQCTIPLIPVLLGEEYEIAGRCRARGAARFGEDHKGKQTDDFWFVRHQHHE